MAEELGEDEQLQQKYADVDRQAKQDPGVEAVGSDGRVHSEGSDRRIELDESRRWRPSNVVWEDHKTDSLVDTPFISPRIGLQVDFGLWRGAGTDGIVIEGGSARQDEQLIVAYYFSERRRGTPERHA